MMVDLCLQYDAAGWVHPGQLLVLVLHREAEKKETLFFYEYIF